MREALEHKERTAFSMVVQALRDYSEAANTVFREETDLPQDIAEDVTREAIDAMGLPGLWGASVRQSGCQESHICFPTGRSSGSPHA